MLAARGAPQLEAGQPAEGEQRLTDGAGGPMHENALAPLRTGHPVEELVRGRPAQDQRGRLRRVEARRHAGQAVSPKRPIGGVRTDHRQIGHAVANLKAAHAIAELIDFPDHIISEHERRPAGRSLRVEVTPDQHVGVLHARGEHAGPHLAPAGRRQGSVDDHLEPVGIAEARDLNNTVARLSHGRIPCDLMIPRTARKGRNPCDAPAVSCPYVVLQQRYTN